MPLEIHDYGQQVATDESAARADLEFTHSPRFYFGWTAS